MGKAAKLERAASAEAVIQDRLVADFERELAGVLRRTDRRIGQLVRTLDTDAGRLVSNRASLGRALRMRKDLVKAFDQAGYQELAANATDTWLDDLLARVLEHDTIAARAAKLTATDLQGLTAFKELRLADLLDWRDDTARLAWRVTLDGVLGLRRVDHLVADLADALDVSAPRARTLYDTAVSTYSRQVNLLHATGEPDELFYYAGPLDSVTRTFCKERVGKVFRRAEIDLMDNGQIPDVLVTGGGFNCRHTFKRVSILDEELRQLHETGGRLPHVQAQLDALEAEKKAK